MAYKFITVPQQSPQQAEEELNAFLRSHRVLAVERRWIEGGVNSCWAFCVDYLESKGSSAGEDWQVGGRSRVDYREVLNASDFAIFARLRQWRKEVAQAEGVPVYTVFTNEQFAQMVQGRVTTRTGLEKIAGVGDGRIEKYGPRVLEILKPAWGEVHEADGQPV